MVEDIARDVRGLLNQGLFLTVTAEESRALRAIGGKNSEREAVAYQLIRRGLDGEV